MALVSIITIARDHETGLRETFASVAGQDYPNWEMLIVVGVSKDSTLETAKDFAQLNSRVRVIEQSGLGIFGAMNEGIENTRGEFTWFMNAGDKFADAHILGIAVNEITRAKVGLVIGGYRIDGGKEWQVYSYPKKEISGFAFAFSRRGGCHQAMIFRTSNLKRLGGYDLAYSLNSDFALVLRVIESAGALRVSEIYAAIEPGGVADQNIFTVHREKHQIRRGFFGNASSMVFLSWMWTFAAGSKIYLRRTIKLVHSIFS